MIPTLITVVMVAIFANLGPKLYRSLNKKPNEVEQKVAYLNSFCPFSPDGKVRADSVR